MDANLVTLIIGIVAASPSILALIFGWRKARAERSKLDADAAKTITDAAEVIVKMKDADVSEMRSEMKDLRVRVRHLEQVVALLEAQLRAAGIVPKSIPETAGDLT